MSDKEEYEDDEDCFAGEVVELREDHVRIRMDVCSKKDDVWMLPLNSPKLFLDVGRWGEEGSEEELPPLHYWREEDRKEDAFEISRISTRLGAGSSKCLVG